MKVFLKYLLLNLILIIFHIVTYFIGAMALGGRTGTENFMELALHVFFIGLIGASPNLILFAVSFFRKRNVRLNVIWASFFSTLIIVGYFLMFSSVFN